MNIEMKMIPVAFPCPPFQLTISSYGVDVMGMFLRGVLLIVANFSLYDRE